MPLIEPLDEGALNPELRASVQFFKGPLGVVPNSVRTMAYRPDIASAFTVLNQAVMACHGNVTPEFKRLIGYMTSFVTGCRYCQAHTILASERFGASDDRLSSIWSFEDSPHFSEAEKSALAFARAAASVPNTVDAPIGAALRAHWSDGDIVEIMAVIALFGYLNRWNDSMGTSLEDLPSETAQRRISAVGWTPGKHRARAD